MFCRGSLLGLGVLWLFLATPLRFFLYGTVWGIAFALILARQSGDDTSVQSRILQLGGDLEEVGAGERRVLVVHVPAHSCCHCWRRSPPPSA